MPDQPITLLIHAAREGDVGATERAWRVLYPELVKIARSRLRGAQRDTLLDTQSLVHESFVRLVRSEPFVPGNRKHFYAYAAKTMRHIVIDYARRKAALRHGGDAVHVTLDTAALGTDADAGSVLEIEDALAALDQLDPKLAQVVEMRYYGGYSDLEIAQAMDITDRTVRRHWDKARAFILAQLSG
jgi:RNA polymerase sigma factor (TIGR02999 family)